MPPPMASQNQNATHRVTLTDAETTLFSVDLPSGETTGGLVMFRVHASNGTDHQSLCGTMTFAAVNKAGTITDDETYATANEAKAASSGTLTLAFAVNDATNKIDVTLTPTGSLTETVYYVDFSVFMVDPKHFFSPA